MNSSITVRSRAAHRQPPSPRARHTDAGFAEARQDLEALGVRITAHAHLGSSPFLVLQPHRADPRRWLVPLHPRRARVASLALIQPGRLAARVLKQAAIRAHGIGLGAAWASGRVHISGLQAAVATFDRAACHVAFYTGTPGPHRKTVLQLMDAQGAIRGYVKVCSSAAAGALLLREAEILEQLPRLGFRSAWVPRVRFYGASGALTVLATDTIKTLHSPCPVRLQRAHRQFLRELNARAAARWAMRGEALLAQWDAQVKRLADVLPRPWNERFRDTLDYLAPGAERVASPGLAHGDFTPTNTFLERGHLGVFDWEYAGGAYPADFDLVRFLGCRPALRRMCPVERGAAMARALETEFGRTALDANLRVIAYLCVYALRCARRERCPRSGPLTWAGEADQAGALDALLLHLFRR